MKPSWIVGAGAALLLLAAVPAQADPDWLAYSDPKGGFTVDLPREPTVKIEQVEETATHETVPLSKYMIDEGSCAMIVMDGDFTASPSTLDVEAAVRGMLSDGRVLKSESVIQLDGHEGRYAVLTDSNGYQLTDMVFVVGRHLYQAITVLPAAATPAQAAEIAHFAQSFHLAAH